jgi:hypothetical protein
MDTTAAIVAEASTAFERARAYTVTTNEHYEAAASELISVKGVKKRLEMLRVWLKEPVLEMGRRVDDLFREPREQLEQAESAITTAMTAYSREQKRLADEQARAAHAALVEQRRLEAEAEAARVAVPVDDFDESEPEPEPYQAPVVPMVAPVEIVMPTAKGVHTRSTWRARVTNLGDLVRAAADGDGLAMSLLKVDDSVLAALAKSRKGGLMIPGVEAYEDSTLVAKAR